MNHIDHPVLYSDDFINDEWKGLIDKSDGRSGFWRKYARRKMRRVVRELLSDVRPRITLGWDCSGV